VNERPKLCLKNEAIEPSTGIAGLLASIKNRNVPVASWKPYSLLEPLECFGLHCGYTTEYVVALELMHPGLQKTISMGFLISPCLGVRDALFPRRSKKIP
ncbi:MAG: hypothetical protein QXJ27_07645, partial [Thermoplasmata archaeon]